jgi:thioredoxin reductase (NADPH)
LHNTLNAHAERLSTQHSGLSTKKTMNIDIAIIGAGPIGLELAIALQRAGREYVQFDAGQIGSTIAWYAPQTHFFSSPERIAIAGVPLQTLDQTKATREEYLNYLRAVVLQFDLRIRTYTRVTSLTRDDDGSFALVTNGNAGQQQWRARNVILAIGDMHRPRLIDVPGEELPHVSHYFAEPHAYFRRRVLIVGGKNSAIEAAIRCVRVGAAVTLVYRGAELDPDHIKFWLLPEIRGMVRDGRIRFEPGANVREIRRDAVVLERAGEIFEIVADDVLLMTGYTQNNELLVQAGVTLEGPGQCPQLDRRTMETNVRRLYVAGTAVAGTQLGGVKEFIETSHIHVERILAALSGQVTEASAPSFEMPES